MWSCPSVSGSYPPPLSHFTLNMIDSHRAVLFAGSLGGVQVDNTNDVYILDINTMVCKNHWALLFACG